MHVCFVSLRSSRRRRASRRERLRSKPTRPRLYLECPCCGHPDCVPDTGLDPDWPELGPRWLDETEATCPECGCLIRVDVTDDYAKDARAWALCVDDMRDQDCPCGGAL